MKFKRQSKIIEIIKAHNIETQEELSERLLQQGFAVTQATISRDIHELKLTKVPAESGGFKYAIMNQNESSLNDRLIRIFCDGVMLMDYAQNMLVIKTHEGMAMAVAAALDAMSCPEIVGTIAGDDTIFCAIKNEEQAIKLMGRLNELLKQEGN